MSSQYGNLLIREVKIENFKIYKNKVFTFNDNKIILITGANGFGKSTLIDAIEWCLTGNIKRIKNCFDDRNTNNTEKNRVDNKSGIIKNTDCKKNDKVKVTMILKLNDEIFEIYREQAEDSLNCNTELQYVTQIKNETKEILKNLINSDDFYNYHVCDSHKSYDFLRNSRQELLDVFRDFLKDRPNIDITVSNLEKLSKSITDKKEKKERKLESEEKIQLKKDLIEDIKSKLKKLEYPKKNIFEGEIVEIDNLDKKMLELQLEKLNISAYNTSKEILQQIENFYESKEKIIKYKELEKYFYENESEINSSINKAYYDKSKLDDLLKQVALLENKKTKVQNIKQLKDLNEFLEKNDNYLKNDNVEKKNKEIETLKDKYIEKKHTIDNMQKGNSIIEALSDIIKVRKGILDYKEEGNSKCPLCGSDEYFSKIIDENNIGKIASDYLKNNNSNIADMKIQLDNISKEITEKLELIKSLITTDLQGKINKENDAKKEFENVYNAHADFFEKVKNSNIPINSYCIKKIQELKQVEEEKLEDDKSIISKKELVFNVLTTLDIIKDVNLEDIDNIKKLKIKISSLCSGELKVIDFKFDLFNTKVLYINNLLENHVLQEHEKELKSWEEKNKSINEDLVKINFNILKTKKVIDEISAMKKELEKKELENVGPYLSQIFHKIIKHSNVGEIKLKRNDSINDGGIVLLDSNGANLMNILSQGQLGVLMMSYFFANMFRRRESSSFKTYFVDDITNCLDDMNVLSFIDMIKYLLSRDNSVINQVFFSTCDDDLEKLFIHKMQSFKINGVNFKFNSYADYTPNEF